MLGSRPHNLRPGRLEGRDGLAGRRPVVACAGPILASAARCECPSENIPLQRPRARRGLPSRERECGHADTGRLDRYRVPHTSPASCASRSPHRPLDARPPSEQALTSLRSLRSRRPRTIRLAALTGFGHARRRAPRWLVGRAESVRQTRRIAPEPTSTTRGVSGGFSPRYPSIQV
jgi:hypothetical protein